MKSWKDEDGDNNISLNAGALTVFATEQLDGSYSVNFCLSSDLGDDNWMETLTGLGAFATIRLIRPAVEQIISAVEDMGRDWSIHCDARRAKLYSRYVPVGKINITK
jgi:hypothetical protein